MLALTQPDAAPTLPALSAERRQSPLELHQQTLAQRRSRRMAGVALALGLLAELLFDGVPLGLSLPVFVAAAALGLFALCGAERWQQAGRSRWLLVPIGFFAAMVAVRDSGALTLANTAACLLLGALLVQLFAGERASEFTVGELLLTAAKGATFGLLAGPGVISRGANASAFKDGARRLAGPALRAGAITLPLLAIFTALLMAGDEGFARLLTFDAGRLDWGAFAGAGFTVAGVTFAFAGLLAHALRSKAAWDSPSLPAAGKGLLRFSDAMVPLLSVSSIFGLFGLVRLQAVLTFDKYEAAARPEFTYANEAHQSFGALMAVVVLTLLVLHGFARLTRLETRRQQRWFGLAGTALVALTAPVLACGLSRLVLYQQMYGYTELRVYASWAVLVAALLLCWRAVTLWTLQSRFGAGAIAAVLLAVASLDALNPDAYIAEQNLTRPKTIVDLDERYLMSLSADAAQVVAPYFQSRGRSDRADQYLDRVAGPAGFAAWRWSRARARDLQALARSE